MTKTKQDNDMTDRVGVVYAENDTQLVGPIGSGVVYDETRQDNDMIDHIRTAYAKNETK